MNDYIIAVDRDGQPYIAHAWKDHKYIARIGEGANALYFYTQEQLRAFQQGARRGAQKVKNTSDHIKAEERKNAQHKQTIVNNNTVLENKTEQKNVKRPESRKRNVTGKADPIVKGKEELRDKKGHQIGPVGTYKYFDKDDPNDPVNIHANQKVVKKSKFSEYTKGDKDFDDKNFAEKNRVGDSDFFMAKRPDGSTVILEEDMKWVLPKGVNPNDPAIKRALTKEYKAGSNEEWVKQVTEAIDDAVEEANKKK